MCTNLHCIFFVCLVFRFCPSVLFFLIGAIPAIWLMELELLDQRLAAIAGSAANATATSTSNSDLELV